MSGSAVRMRPVDAPVSPETAAETARDHTLMARAQAGDTEAYAELFEHYIARTYRMAYALVHNSAVAEDIVQETFLRGLDKIGSYRGEAPPRSWFASITLNLCRHHHRDGKRAPEKVDTPALDAGRPVRRIPSRGVLTKAVRREANQQLAIAMGYLTAPQREVVTLRFAQGLSYDEIGEMLGMKPGAARALVFRAKAVLRDKLDSAVWASKLV